MPSFYIPLSGLDADSTALNTIANNLSNMSTTGFKTQTTNFSDLMYQQIGSNGSGDEIQVGTGVQVASNSTDFTGGSIASTDVSTNAAIDGTGFFVLDNKGSQLYTRDGDFQTSSTGTLESSNGLAVMGYSATDGVVNTSGGLTDLAIPTTGTVMAPSATTSLGLTQNLDSADAVGSTYSGTVTVYDSMGTSYTANVAYTKTGTDQWSYNITMPDTLSAAPPTTPAATTLPVAASAATSSTSTTALAPSSAALLGNTTYSYNFGTSGTVDPTSSISIDGSTITVPGAGETVTDLEGQINALTGTTGVSANVSTVNGSSVLTITGPTATIPTPASIGSIVADLPVSTTNYDFGSSATVDAATSLTITGQDAAGNASSITVTAGADESVAAYFSQINTALAAAAAAGNLTNASVSSANNQLSITGTGITITGSASQDLTASTINYSFGSSNGTDATVNTGTNLAISGLTSSGASATITAPTVTSGETLATYAADLTSALSSAGIAGVTVSANNGTLSITGANLSTSGSVIQDPVASANTSGTLTFDSSGNLISPATDVSNITFAGLSDGAATMDMKWDLFGSNGTGLISQTDVASDQSAETQNGYTSGAYNGTFSIGSNGLITADYSNGQDQTVGQIALATMSNLQGLADVGSTEYETTSASGLASVGAAGSDGLGTIEGSSLEASNVNISAEFSDLIVAQRAFEANAKSVTTFDTITQETINMIH
jgi:flagellar hook protein FlgE